MEDKAQAARRRSIKAAEEYAKQLAFGEDAEAKNTVSTTSSTATSLTAKKGSKRRKKSIVQFVQSTKDSIVNATLRRKNGATKRKLQTKARKKKNLPTTETTRDDSEEVTNIGVERKGSELSDDSISSRSSHPEFDGIDPWKALDSKVYTCNNDLDNNPEFFQWKEYNLYISQNREGHKEYGQDCIGTASEKSWEVVVLCDGHDAEGLDMSYGVCSTLPHFLLRRICGRQPENLNDPVEDQIILDAFEECENIVAWSGEEFEYGEYAKKISGKLAGEIGYIAAYDPRDVEATVVIESKGKGYHRVTCPISEIRTPRYQGGSTCVTFIRNTETNQCRVAILGDSRLMVLAGKEGLFGDRDDDPLFAAAFIYSDKRFENAEELRPLAFFTPQHCIDNPYELERLEASDEYEYKLDVAKGYLINPKTKFQIQPTRGFGDIQMTGTGYSKVPEISNTFVLPPNSVVLGASDGIFDGDIWEDDSEFCTFVEDLVHHNKRGDEIAKIVYYESLKRCKEASSIDDISLFVLMSPREDGEMERTPLSPEVVENSKIFKRKRSAKGSIKKVRRGTVSRITSTRKSITNAMQSGMRRGSTLMRDMRNTNNGE